VVVVLTLASLTAELVVLAEAELAVATTALVQLVQQTQVVAVVVEASAEALLLTVVTAVQVE
jgi:hypothetical protein